MPREATELSAKDEDPREPRHAPTRDEPHTPPRDRPHAGQSAQRARLLPLAAALCFGVVALVPQLMLWRDRGEGWQGHAASVHPDEAAYRAYVNALASGRARRSDPYTGRDAEMNAAGVETMFSIQCLPAYALAVPARLFGVSADAVFVALTFFAAFLSLLAVERLVAAAVARAPNAAWLSTAGALFVLSFAALARAQKLVYWLTGNQTFYTPLLFLRRYLPAAVFPLLFVFCLLTWRALTSERRRAALAYAAGAGAVFAALVYSYFYLWTAALAWLACLALPWLLLIRDGRRRAAEVFSIVCALALAALVPYAFLLARRPAWMDSDQLLVRTHAPDLFRPPELIGLACLFALGLAARRGVISLRERRAVFAASFALAPAAVFNQQIITGLSLQPIHYELFAANYLALVALVLTAALPWHARGQSEVSTPRLHTGAHASPIRNPQSAIRHRPYPRRALVAVALLSLGWAAFEISLVARRFRASNALLDETRAAALRLAALADGDAEPSRGLVLVTDGTLSDWLQGVAPQPVLWAAHMHSFGAVSPAEDRERLFTQFYMSGVDAREFEETLLRQYRGSIFGWGRAFYGLSADYRPVTPEEERAAAAEYARFAGTFGPAEAARFPLAHAVVDDSRAARLANLDRWYERQEIGRAGRHTFYRLRPRR